MEGTLAIPGIVRTSGVQDKICWPEPRDILYFRHDGRKLIFYTFAESVMHLYSIEDMLFLLESNNFTRLDRVNIVNLSLVTKVDYEFGKVYFDKEVHNKSLYATVSRKYLPQLKLWLEQECAIFPRPAQFPKIPCIRMKKGLPFEAKWIDINKELCFIAIEKRRIAYYSTEDIFYPPQTFDEMLFVLQEQGFWESDVGIAVNIKRIQQLNFDYGCIAYFDESRFVTVSAKRIRELKSLFQSLD